MFKNQRRAIARRGGREKTNLVFPIPLQLSHFLGEKLDAGHSGDLLSEKFSTAEKPDESARLADGMIRAGRAMHSARDSQAAML